MNSHDYKFENRNSGLELFQEITDFSETRGAYRDFVTNAAILNNNEMPDFLSGFDSAPQSLIQSRREIGLNVFYNIYVTRPRGAEFQISIPWKFSESCPHCQGQGRIYTWNADNSAYEPFKCDECDGEGCHSHDSEISIFIDDTLCEQPIIRKRKAGRFNPRLNQRGDLIININWVDDLPPIGETVN